MERENERERRSSLSSLEGKELEPLKRALAVTAGFEADARYIVTFPKVGVGRKHLRDPRPLIYSGAVGTLGCAPVLSEKLP